MSLRRVSAAGAISCSPREAIYVLDGLLENETVLRPRGHYTLTPDLMSQPPRALAGAKSGLPKGDPSLPHRQ